MAKNRFCAIFSKKKAIFVKGDLTFSPNGYLIKRNRLSNAEGAARKCRNRI